VLEQPITVWISFGDKGETMKQIIVTTAIVSWLHPFGND
jgi:hypothetical protein